MAALVRLIIIGGILLTIVYVALSMYSRAVRRGTLEADWNVQGRPGSMEDFVSKGLKEYEGSLRRKLILLVYIVPISVVTTIVYLTNYS